MAPTVQPDPRLALFPENVRITKEVPTAMAFPLTITGRHIEVTEALRDHAVEKMNHACRLLDKISAAHITFSVEKYRHISEVVIQVRGVTLRSKEETNDMYASIDQAMEKIEAQAKRLKEKIKDKKRQDERESSEFEEELAVESPRVFESETFAAKPLTVDDALRELSNSEGHFLAFRNAKTNEVNVLYKRNDGHFGLVQPH
jgi:putative sigma-54 modulation protein